MYGEMKPTAVIICVVGLYGTGICWDTAVGEACIMMTVWVLEDGTERVSYTSVDGREDLTQMISYVLNGPRIR